MRTCVSSRSNDRVAAFCVKEFGGGGAVEGEFEEAGAAPDGKNLVFRSVFIRVKLAKRFYHCTVNQQRLPFSLWQVRAGEVRDAVAETIDVNYPSLYLAVRSLHR